MIELVKRPILRYHGGKWILAKWIISQFPKHKIYTETFGGAASVLLQKNRCHSEVYNDLDEEVVNLFNVMRENGRTLKHLLFNTPYSRTEFLLSYEPSIDPIEKARRTVVRSFMGRGSGSIQQKTGFRARNGHEGGTASSKDWANYPDHLDSIIRRLRGVCIENKNAMDVMIQHDTDQTLHYVDPPYVLDTRSKGQSTKVYSFELTNDQHVELCKFLRTLKGTVVLSGYENEIYKEFLFDWKKVQKESYADGMKNRTEVLWINRVNEKPNLFNSL